jgi:ketosteroid isomerase-like protein
MSEQDNIRAVEQAFDDINTKNLGRSADLYDPGYKFEGPGAPGPMPYEPSLAYIQGFITAFPDLHFALKHKIADGDNVAVTWTAIGTHTGPMLTPTGATIPPTGKKGVINGCTTYEFKGNKIVASATYWDMVSLLTQLGLMPGM